MTYQNKFVVVVKSNSSILREHDGTVTLPFGSEYSLLLKNLNSNASLIKISIDSNDVLDGKGLIIQGNCEKELLGFIKNRQVTNRFKFIQKTKDIVEHRGDKIDDGIIRIEFRFKKEVHEVVTKYSTYYEPYPWYPWYLRYPYCPEPYRPICSLVDDIHVTSKGDDVIGSEILTGGSTLTADNIQCNTITNANIVSCFSAQANSINLNVKDGLVVGLTQDEGITVHGSQAHQQLQPAHIGDLESQSQVIIIKLRGINSGGIEIVEPITVKTKLECPTCGKRNKSSNAFCGKCGTSLL